LFEIRVTCEPTEATRLGSTLAATFQIINHRQYPTRDGKRTRLYITADNQPAEQRPTPEPAYALAPSIVCEIGWTAQAAADKPFGTRLGREFWLRKAALLDRIALRDEADGIHSDAANVAVEAAHRLMDLDDSNFICEPRAYVRQHYAAWAKQNQRAELVADGSCPNCQWPEHDCNCAEHPDA
jgi:hypothetical protein